MGRMNLFDMILVGIPEVIILLLIGIQICKDKNFYKCKKSNILFIIKLFISCILILSIIYIVRLKTNNNFLIFLMNSLVFTLVFKFVFEFNWRESILTGFILLFVVGSLEFFTLPISIIIKDNFTSNRFLMSLPVRLLELLLLIIVIKCKISLNKIKFVNIEWKELSLSYKLNMWFFLLLIILCGLFMNNYFDLSVKLKKEIFFSENVLFISFEILCFIILVSVIEFEILNKKEVQDFFNLRTWNKLDINKKLYFIRVVGAASPEDEMNKYAKTMIDAFHIRKIVDLKKFLDYIKKNRKGFSYILDDNICVVDYDYTNLMYLVGYIINVDFITNKNVQLYITTYEENVETIMSIEIDEISLKKLLKEMENKEYQKLVKKLITNDNAKYSREYDKGILKLNIKVPIKKYYKEVCTNEKI